MATLTTTDLITGRAFLECPRWRDDRLWISDLHRHEVLTVTMDGVVSVVATLDDQPTGLGFLPDGTPLVVSLTERVLLRIDVSNGGKLSQHGDMRALTVGGTNDMVVDANGRAYIGSFGYDLFAEAPEKPGNIVRVDADGSARVVADDMIFPNGMVITPDGKTLIAAETHAKRLTAFDIDAAGNLSGRRLFAQLDDDPDGICQDAAGAIWVGYPRGKCFVRVLDGGEITDTIKVATRGVACSLGGPDGHTFFAATAKFWRDTDGKVQGESKLETTRVDVPAA